MKKEIFICFLFFSLCFTHSIHDDSCQEFQIIDIGKCDANQTNFFMSSMISCCQDSYNETSLFTEFLQAQLGNYSTLAVYNEDTIGYFICLGDPCYLSASVGPYGLVAVFIGESCDGSKNNQIYLNKK